MKLRVSEIAKKFKISNATVYNMINKGLQFEPIDTDILGRKAHNAMLIDVSDFRKFRKKLRKKPKPKEKYCTKCETTKKISEFYPGNNGVYCKKCKNKIDRANQLKKK